MRAGSRSPNTLTGGNRNDVTQLIPLLERVPPVAGSSAGQGVARTKSSATAATTTTSTAASYARWASGR
jgi:hypothetical protein